MIFHRKSILALILLLFPILLMGQRVSQLEFRMQQAGLINIQSLDKSIRVELKYATADNFTKTVLYDSLVAAYLQPVAARKLVKAQRLLKDINSDYSLLIYDAARPLSVQRKMYRVVQGTNKAAYVANPANTGMHNYGMAVDLTICDGDGRPLDMGTPFDFFGRAAAIRDEEGLIRQGSLTRTQVDNRNLLRRVMTAAGFVTIQGEWWHFNAASKSETRRLYKVIE